MPYQEQMQANALQELVGQEPEILSLKKQVKLKYIVVEYVNNFKETTEVKPTSPAININ